MPTVPVEAGIKCRPYALTLLLPLGKAAISVLAHRRIDIGGSSYK